MGLTPDEKKLYSQLFKTLDPENTGIITGEKARTTFEKSGLPPTILGEIWQLSDQNNLGFLTQFGFCYAMRLIGYTQAGNHPSSQLADHPGPLPKFANLNLTPPLAPPGALQPQSTNSSFMQTQPSSVVPQNSATHQSTPQDPISSISSTDFQKFSQLFTKTTGSAESTLNGATARDIFLKAKLPTTTLSQIWNLVDRDNSGLLSLGGFVIAMHLIQGILGGTVKQLPPFLPESVWQSVQAPPSIQQQQQPTGSRQSSHGSVNSQQTTIQHPISLQRDILSSDSEWKVNSDQVQQYNQLFKNLDKTNSGQLSPGQVASFLMTSKLNQQDLASVWDLSDIQNTGIFTQLEFSIALFLVKKKLNGEQLPNIVPDTLVESIRQFSDHNNSTGTRAQQVVNASPAHNAYASDTSHQIAQSTPQPIQRQKTAMDDLVDIFGPSNDTPSPSVSRRTSSSDLSHSSNLTKARTNLTGSFKPTSTFGQSLVHKQPLLSPKEDDENLIGDDVYHGEKSPVPVATNPISSPPISSPSISTPHQSVSAQQSQERKAINYDALRTVPPPPPEKRSNANSFQSPGSPNHMSSYVSSGQQGISGVQDKSISAQQFQSQQQPQQQQQQPLNNDLLSENSEISGQLSQTTSDIANISNQVKSLTTQTTDLHDKKLRAEQELTRISQIKTEVENKLKQLRTSYQNEVKQVDQVDATLALAKEETEALRSEASISEAKLNTLSSQLHEKQVTVEDLQKSNSTLKEKLGFLNAEIVELEKQLESKSAENQRLSNQASVKKSQVQVSIIKAGELKSKISELEESNKRLQQEHDEAVEKEIALEKEKASLAERQAAAASFKPTTRSVESTSKNKGVVAGTAVGATVVGALGAIGTAGSHFLHGSDNEAENRQITASPSENDTTKQIDPQQQSKDNQPSGFSVGALVDEVKENPSADMTGIDDVEQVDKDTKASNFTEKNDPNSRYNERPDAKSETIDEINERFPDLSTNGNTVNQTTSSSIATNSYKNAEDSETPITSPSNSDFQFPQNSSAGVVGGLVGMPGVLVGVQRTDSLTSSVQNNAALSVRDDNIDEISDRDTLDIETPNGSSPPNSSATHVESRNPGHQEDSSEGDKLSSGVESFEIVNADEAGPDNQYNYQEDRVQSGSSVGPKSETFIIKNLGQTQSVKYNQGEQSNEVEFPPIRELDYDESSSEDDESQDKFDDAVDNFQQSNTGAGVTKASPTDEFDSVFDGLQPASQESHTQTKGDDFFADEFDDLEAAQVDNNADDDFNQNEDDFGFSDDFTEAPKSNAGASSNHPDFSGDTAAGKDNNDEWEQLFAGFGNQQAESQPIAQSQEPHVVSGFNSSQDDAVQELVGMGFDEKTVIEALNKEQWNLEAATNYLLDNA